MDDQNELPKSENELEIESQNIAMQEAFEREQNFGQEEYIEQEQPIEQEKPIVQEQSVNDEKTVAKKAPLTKEEKEEKDKIRAKEKRAFDPLELYSNYFEKENIRTESMNALLENSQFHKKDVHQRDASILAFLDYVKDINENNGELDNEALSDLNRTALMYLGMTKNLERPENTLSDLASNKEYAYSLLDNLLTTRVVDREFLTDVLNETLDLDIENENPKFKDEIDAKGDIFSPEVKDILTEYMTPEKQTLLLAKYKSLNEKSIDRINKIVSSEHDNLNIYYIERLMNHQKYKDLNIKELLVTHKDDKDYCDKLRDAEKTRPSESKQFAKISDNNKSIFKENRVSVMDTEYYDRAFEKFIEDHELEKEKFRRQQQNRLLSLIGRGSNEDHGRLFHTNIMGHDQEAGTKYIVLEVSPFTKQINVPSRVTNDSTYTLMAIAARKKGIEEPFITVRETDPEYREAFVTKTVQALLEQGYDIEKIKVQDDCKHYLERFKNIQTGLTDAKEISDEQKKKVGLGVSSEENNTQRTDLGNDNTEEPKQVDPNVEKLMNEGKKSLDEGMQDGNQGQSSRFKQEQPSKEKNNGAKANINYEQNNEIEKKNENFSREIALMISPMDNDHVSKSSSVCKSFYENLSNIEKTNNITGGSPEKLRVETGHIILKKLMEIVEDKNLLSKDSKTNPSEFLKNPNSYTEKDTEAMFSMIKNELKNVDMVGVLKDNGISTENLDLENLGNSFSFNPKSKKEMEIDKSTNKKEGTSNKANSNTKIKK
jgi:hypothetical protein